MEIDSRPVEIDELQRAVDRMKMEELALARESDAASRDRLERLRADLADRQEQLTALIARWDQEKAGLNRVGELKSRLDDLKGQAERAQRDADFEAAARLMYGEIPALEHELAEASAAAASDAEDGSAGSGSIPAEAPMVKEEVGPDDVADVVSSWTGIPAGRLLEGETGELHDQAQAESEAERGYEVETLLRRRWGGRLPLGSAAASVESVRLDPELKRAVLIPAAEEHVSVSEVIRRAIGEYLRAS
jgi:ATP-dependent Clp protease ATP-binding subunit ClpA